MAAELAGRLRERVVLLRQLSGAGPAAEAAGSWVSVAERWAMVEAASRTALSALEGDTRQTARRWRVTLRAGLVVDLGMRLSWRGVVLRLTGIDDDPTDPRLLVLVAEELGG